MSPEKLDHYTWTHPSLSIGNGSSWSMFYYISVGPSWIFNF